MRIFGKTAVAAAAAGIAVVGTVGAAHDTGAAPLTGLTGTDRLDLLVAAQPNAVTRRSTSSRPSTPATWARSGDCRDPVSSTRMTAAASAIEPG
jgi:hypothetical protein